jgi:hypothetical protein
MATLGPPKIPALAEEEPKSSPSIVDMMPDTLQTGTVVDHAAVSPDARASCRPGR